MVSGNAKSIPACVLMREKTHTHTHTQKNINKLQNKSSLSSQSLALVSALHFSFTKLLHDGKKETEFKIKVSDFLVLKKVKY